MLSHLMNRKTSTPTWPTNIFSWNELGDDHCPAFTKLGHAFLNGMSHVRHVSDTDTRTTRIGKVSNSKDILLDI